MDLSGIIFVALAVAWAVYLIPKALKHHDEVVRSRSVDRFSHTMRVLARREPVSSRDARLVVTPARGASTTVVETKAARPTPAQLQARRAAARKATRRRRRVLGTLLLANAGVTGVAAYGLIVWWWESGPAALVVLWLVACRLMVRKERAPYAVTSTVAAPEPAQGPDVPEAGIEVETDHQGFTQLAPAADTSTIPPVIVGDPNLWDPLPMTLPTYVSKPAATRRTVRTISLDDTGVWSSGHAEADSALAREADAARAAEAAEAGEGDQRAVGT